MDRSVFYLSSVYLEGRVTEMQGQKQRALPSVGLLPTHLEELEPGLALRLGSSRLHHHPLPLQHISRRGHCGGDTRHGMQVL